MRKIFLFITVMLFLLSGVSFAKNVTSTGYGITSNEAENNALRAAVENTLGVLIDSETLVQNNMVINDQIYTQSRGFITNYNVINRSQLSSGEWQVTINAVVDDNPNSKLMNELTRLGIIDNKLRNPKIAVYIPEHHIQYRVPDPAGETAVVKALVEAGAEDTDELWGDDWSKGKYADGKTFCFFGPAWLFSFSLAQDDPDSIAANGGWGFCEGPQPYYWGGTWICAAAGTDNAEAVKDLILTMTTDQAVLKEMAIADSECVNSKTVLADLASSDEGNLDILGGQNPYEQLAAGAEKIDLSNLSPYDQGCNEELQNAMKAYFEGTADKDACLDQFYNAVIEKYPNLSK